MFTMKSSKISYAVRHLMKYISKSNCCVIFDPKSNISGEIFKIYLYYKFIFLCFNIRIEVKCPPYFVQAEVNISTQHVWLLAGLDKELISYSECDPTPNLPMRPKPKFMIDI